MLRLEEGGGDGDPLRAWADHDQQQCSHRACRVGDLLFQGLQVDSPPRPSAFC